MAILKIPTNKTSWAAKFAFAHAAREKMRLLHNVKGEEHRDGKTTRLEFLEWVQKYYDPRDQAVTMEILALKQTPPAADMDEVDFVTSFEGLKASGISEL